MKNKAVFLDRDGTINIDFSYVYKVEHLKLLPGVLDAMYLFQKAGYLIIVITNQSGVGRGYYSLEDVVAFNNELRNNLQFFNVSISDFYICPHAPEEECECRKPSSFLLEKAMSDYDIDPTLSYMFGDKESDVLCGENAHVKSFLITEDHSLLYWAKKLLGN